MNNYVVKVFEKENSDNFLTLEYNSTLLQELNFLNENSTYKKITKFMLDSMNLKGFIIQDALLDENNRHKRYYKNNAEMSFPKFLILCFMEKETLNLEKLRNNLLLGLLGDIKHKFEEENSSAKHNITNHDIQISKKIFSIIDSQYDIEKLITDLKKN